MATNNITQPTYQTRTLETGTTFQPEMDGTWLMADFNGLGKNNDLVFIKAGASVMEVHVASAASNYQTRTLETGTTFVRNRWYMAPCRFLRNRETKRSCFY